MPKDHVFHFFEGPEHVLAASSLFLGMSTPLLGPLLGHKSALIRALAKESGAHMNKDQRMILDCLLSAEEKVFGVVLLSEGFSGTTLSLVRAAQKLESARKIA